MIKKFLMMTIVIFPLAAGAWDRNLREPTHGSDFQISQSRYVTGGVIGSVVGFGIGHAIQRRYIRDRAWIFTASEALAVTYIFASGLFACDGVNVAERDSCSDRVKQKFLAGSLVYWGFHIWETIDVWSGVDVQKRKVSIGPTLLHSEAPGLLFALKF